MVLRLFDDRPLVRFSVMVILKVGDRRERGSSGGGGRYSYDEIIDTKFAYEFADEAIRQAAVNLQAEDGKSRVYDSCLGTWMAWSAST